jgi:2-C-methyl-D-erythritol 4-phosphate cytidylyltransferase
MSLGLIITAAGASTRFGEPKQFFLIHDEPMIIRTVKAFAAFDQFTECVISIHEEGKDTLDALLAPLTLPFDVRTVIGGETRRESVEIAVNALENTKTVLIHDGARPFVSKDVIQRVIDATSGFDAVIPGVPSVDTLKRVKDGVVDATLNREDVFRIQTPQAFSVEVLKQAYRDYSGPEATDEAMLVEKQNVPIKVVLGDESNKKVTFKTDCN